MRRILHIDMDAFYASVAQRDDPSLRGRPVVVAQRTARAVVCAASYEARTYGIRSAMPALRAARLCPDAVFVPPDFSRYRAVSLQVRAIFLRHTPLVEPLSLDEAYLDVTDHLGSHRSATSVAEAIRHAIREELGLTASAGVAPNRFLAKVASDINKPDGLFVVKPGAIDRFLLPLPVTRLSGVGRVGAARLAEMGIHTIAELRAAPGPLLEQRFGRWGAVLHDRARGIDDTPIRPNRPRRSVSAEDTLTEDLPLAALTPHITRMADRTWQAAEKANYRGRTIVLKLKTEDFRICTRSVTPLTPPANAAEVARHACALAQRVDAPSQRFRLVGVGLTNSICQNDSAGQTQLFD